MRENVIKGVISQMVERVENDPTLTEERREDVLRDVEILQLHLEKNERNDPFMVWFLCSLEKISSISSLVKELRSQIELSFRHNA